MSDVMPRLSEAQLSQLQKKLLQLKSDLSAQLALAEPDSQPVKLDQQAVGRLSRMDAMQQQQMALANRQQVKTHLRAVMIALQATESGDYGYCCECGEDIGFTRLEVRPEVTLCLPCQQLSE
jgi:DnaK suppressor protein